MVDAMVVVAVVASLGNPSGNPSPGDQFCHTHSMQYNHQNGLWHTEHTTVRAASISFQKVMVSTSSAMEILATVWNC